MEAVARGGAGRAPRGGSMAVRVEERQIMTVTVKQVTTATPPATGPAAGPCPTPGWGGPCPNHRDTPKA